MSHFAVLVVSNAGEKLDDLLAPYHEFECTGTDNEYVQDIDVTDEKRVDYEAGSSRRYVDADGGMHDPYDARFYAEPTPEQQAKIGRISGTGWTGDMHFTSKDWEDGRGYRAKVHFIPKDMTEREVPYKDLMTFRAYIEEYEEIKIVPFGRKPNTAKDHKYGYAEIDAKGEVVKVIRRTNPDRQWDWWVLGGRWNGFLRLKEKAHGMVGKPSWGMEAAAPGYVDTARKGDIDFDRMRLDAEIKGRALWNRVREITGGQSWESWDDMLGRFTTREEGKDEPTIDHEQARTEYWEQPAITLLKASKMREFSFSIDDNLALDLDVYMRRCRDGACSLYAFLKDGQWNQRGEMLMFGMSKGEMSQSQWQSRFNAMLDSLPDDAVISVVDCHI